MDPKLRRKLIVSGSGVVVLIGLLVALYIFYLGPRVKVWREARGEVTKREKRLEDLRKSFANQRNPQDEVKVLQEEVKNLSRANDQLKKIQSVGTESSSLPKELQDPDPAIRREMYKDYMKTVMEAAEKKVKEKLKSAQIAPPDIKLYSDLQNADEVAYYMNRAGGLQGLINALAESHSKGGTLLIDSISFEDYATGNVRRDGAVNIMSYSLKMTLDTQTLVSFLYNLKDQDSYYFINQMDITPLGAARGPNQKLSVEARVNTTMVFQSQVQAQVKAVLAKVGRAQKGGGGGWMLAAAGMAKKDLDANKGKSERKWYQFWKWFSK